ncbi:uncharacterized protein BO72DRAFT_525692 [Aspergillus fijiensis CBS 313.89]|uniref:Fungal STAND N-terminal Goodbye domain-containing protein n=1 Tax=Aspergillus fijiensis CBS 313.89 TaxID=1448319 RepID=A0A8G1RYB3_9EURO|nr:uncharacterized protein BO72DRAFT_525692 [Aspergillus fijiensis CBS 313.89]RAK80020.1 hypothetical protein BO72DRAFT_525692 [Aspergillus fijiensis CBS 313.89]
MTATSEPNDEHNLQEAWERVCRSFAQTTKVDLTTAPNYTIEEVLEWIRVREAEDLERNAKYKEGKAVIDKTLAFVKVLGGIVAQGASMMFAPSSLCFNAIAYLIDTGAKFKRIFSSLAELFRRVCDVLDRMQIYMRLPSDAVDVALRKILNEQLLCFVDICALSIKLLQGHKVLIALKVFAFSGDEGVSAQLARLATLGERESQMRATLGFESQKASERRIFENAEETKIISTAVEQLLDSERMKNVFTVESRTLHDLDIALGKPRTGAWLLNDPFYTFWARVDQESCSILGIDGSEGCGKSFLVAHIIKHLRAIHLNDDDGLRPSSIAYHFFGHYTETQSLIRALNIISWQIANADPAYRKDLSSVDMTSTSDLEILWNRLFVKSYATDSCFFMLLDGLEQLDKGEVGQLLALLVELHTTSTNWGKFQLHILLMGQDETMNMKKFIESRVDRLDIFGGSSEQVVSIRRETLETLMREIQGDFVSTGLLLDEISTKQRPGEIRDILARSGQNRQDIIGRKIDRLNATLGKEDIAELNELLT